MHAHSKKEHKEEKHAQDNEDLASKYAAVAREVSNAGTANATVTEHDKDKQQIEEAPVIKETIKEVEFRRVQPVIHRTREQTEVRHVVVPVVQQSVAPVETTQVIRETGIVREFVPVETTGESHSREIGHQHQHQHSHEVHQHQHMHQSSGGLAASASVTCTHGEGGKIEIHIHPVIYAIGSMGQARELQDIDLQHLVSSSIGGNLCQNCSGQVIHHTPEVREVAHSHNHNSVSMSESTLKEDSSSSSLTNNRLSRFFHTIKSKKPRRKSMRKSGEDDHDSDDLETDSGEDIDESTQRNTELNKSIPDNEHGESSHTHSHESKTSAIEDEVEVVRIVHTPVVI